MYCYSIIVKMLSNASFSKPWRTNFSSMLCFSISTWCRYYWQQIQMWILRGDWSSLVVVFMEKNLAYTLRDSSWEFNRHRIPNQSILACQTAIKLVLNGERLQTGGFSDIDRSIFRVVKRFRSLCSYGWCGIVYGFRRTAPCCPCLNWVIWASILGKLLVTWDKASLTVVYGHQWLGSGPCVLAGNDGIGTVSLDLNMKNLGRFWGSP